MIEMLLFVLVLVGMIKVAADVLGRVELEAEPVPVPVEQRRR